MKQIISALALSLLLFVFASPAFADTRTHKAAAVSFWIPDDWKVDGDASQLRAHDAKEQVALLFMTLDAKDMKSALAALDEQIAKIATDVKPNGAAKKVDINGMEASVIDATGKAEGKAIELSVLIVKTPTNKYLTVFGLLEASAKKTHEANLRKILASIKPIKQTGK